MTNDRRLIIFWLKFVLFVSMIILIPAAEGSIGSVNDTASKDLITPNNLTASQKIIPIASINTTLFITIILIVILLIVGLMAYDMFETYSLEKTKLNLLGTFVSTNSIDKNCDAMQRLLQMTDFGGTKGLARSLMALSIIFIVGVSLAYSVVAYGLSPDGVNNLVSIFAGTVATIIGFYFGTRASEERRFSKDNDKGGKTSNSEPGHTDDGNEKASEEERSSKDNDEKNSSSLHENSSKFSPLVFTGK